MGLILVYVLFPSLFRLSSCSIISSAISEKSLRQTYFIDLTPIFLTWYIYIYIYLRTYKRSWSYEEVHRSGNLICSRPVNQWLILAPYKGPKWVSNLHLSTWGAKQISFTKRNLLFEAEKKTRNVRKHSYMASSNPFRIIFKPVIVLPQSDKFRLILLYSHSSTTSIWYLNDPTKYILLL